MGTINHCIATEDLLYCAQYFWSDLCFTIFFVRYLAQGIVRRSSLTFFISSLVAGLRY